MRMFLKQFPGRIDVGGLSVGISVQGEGQPLLYLHAGHGIDPDARILSCLARRFTVYTVSHPGFGDSDLGPEMDTVDDLSYFYLDVIDQLQLRNLVVAGCSFGSWIALEIGVKQSEKCSHLVLGSPIGVKLTGREDRDFNDLFSVAFEDLPGVLFHDVDRGAEAFCGMNFRDVPADAVKRIARNRESLMRFGWSPLFYSPKLRSRLHRLRTPVLIVQGESDMVTLNNYGRRLAQEISGASSTIIGEAGHYLDVEQPDAFADQIIRFVDGASAK
jgi:pimeloyl-ACP methyl ester carboxylesterase